MLSKERIEQIRKIAESVNILNEIENSDDLQKILDGENIKLRMGDLDSIIPNKEISGIMFLDVKNGVKEIFLNNKHAKTRNRFTLAHELGHYFLHKKEADANNGQLISFRDGEKNTLEEEANVFAAELLMPKTKVYQHARLGVNDTVSLAKIFKVSNHAMEVRIKSLNNE